MKILEVYTNNAKQFLNAIAKENDGTKTFKDSAWIEITAKITRNF